jgi:hypothetical protein
MKPESRSEIYRVAFESANLELTEIAAEVERLRIRKEQLERLITVLKPVLGEVEEAATEVLAQAQPNAQGVALVEKNEADAQPQVVMSDPFQRRIDHVLGIGAGIRDVRKYSRQF